MEFFKIKSKLDIERANWNIKNSEKELIKLKNSVEYYKNKIKHFKLELIKNDLKRSN